MQNAGDSGQQMGGGLGERSGGPPLAVNYRGNNVSFAPVSQPGSQHPARSMSAQLMTPRPMMPLHAAADPWAPRGYRAEPPMHFVSPMPMQQAWHQPEPTAHYFSPVQQQQMQQAAGGNSEAQRLDEMRMPACTPGRSIRTQATMGSGTVTSTEIADRLDHIRGRLAAGDFHFPNGGQQLHDLLEAMAGQVREAESDDELGDVVEAEPEANWIFGWKQKGRTAVERARLVFDAKSVKGGFDELTFSDVAKTMHWKALLHTALVDEADVIETCDIENAHQSTKIGPMENPIYTHGIPGMQEWVTRPDGTKVKAMLRWNNYLN